MRTSLADVTQQIRNRVSDLRYISWALWTEVNAAGILAVSSPWEETFLLLPESFEFDPHVGREVLLYVYPRQLWHSGNP